MTTIKEVRTKVGYINKRYGTNLHVERNYNYYNVYNGGIRVASGCRTAREAYNVVYAYESGLSEMQAIASAKLPTDEPSSHQGGEPNDKPMGHIGGCAHPSWKDYGV